MYLYVPDNLAPNPPILTIVHFCGGNAAGVYGQAVGGGMVAAADQHGFILVLPQTSRNCWDVATEPSLTHGAESDTLAIVHQVDYTVMNYGANADRVYITGTSSGAMTTQAMAATYPDVFKGGVSFAGVPAGCWSVNNPDGQWSAPCAGGEVTHTAEEWGAMARNMYAGYTGFRPRLQLWHGDADSVLSPVNQTESIKQWTNVMGLDIGAAVTTVENIDGTDYNRQQWMDSCGNVVLDVLTEPAGQHGTAANMTAAHSIPFLALDQTDLTDPQVNCVPDTGAGGSPGAGGSGNGNPGGPVAESPTRPTMGCSLSGGPLGSGSGRSGTGAFAWATILALAFAGRRRLLRAGACDE
jgi:poly(hydroxyalkanoate) depolymerase family esterase